MRTAFAHDRLVSCIEIRAEVERVLNVKFGWLIEDTMKAMNEYLGTREDIAFEPTLKGICRDPNDDIVLECAVVAGAHLIVSGDKDLLVLKTYSGISIVTAREYLNQHGNVAI